MSRGNVDNVHVEPACVYVDIWPSERLGEKYLSRVVDIAGIVYRVYIFRRVFWHVMCRL